MLGLIVNLNCRISIKLVALFLVFMTSSAWAQVSEYQVKSAYIYNFLRYIEWDPAQQEGPILVGVVCKNQGDFEALKKELQTKRILGRPLDVKRTSNEMLRYQHHVLFVNHALRGQLPPFYNRIRGTHTLLITCQEENLENTMVNLRLNADQKIEFGINWDNLNKQRFTYKKELLVIGGSNQDALDVWRETQARLEAEQEKVVNLGSEIEKSQREIEQQYEQIEAQNSILMLNKEEIAHQHRVLTDLKELIEEENEKQTTLLQTIGHQQKDLDLQRDIYDSQQRLLKEQKETILAFNEKITAQREEIAEQENVLSSKEEALFCKEQRLSEQSSTIQNQRYTLSLLFPISFVLIVATLLILYSSRQKKKALRQLSEQNELLQSQQEEIEKKQSIILNQADSIRRNANLQMQFLSNTSHELRTPINAILGFSELIETSGQSKKKKEYLHFIHQAAKHVLKISNDILDLSKIEAGKIEFEKIDFCLQDVIEQALNSLAPLAKEKGIRLENASEDHPKLYLKGDPTRLGQILLNLLSNALKFTTKGSVTLSYEGIPAYGTMEVHFSIMDTGIGIPQEKLDVIFEKFTQSEASITRQYGGTGLGLPITKELIELQNGALSIESQLNRGSTFLFMLPFQLADSMPVQDETPAASTLVQPHQEEEFKILVIDDNHVNRVVLKELLGSTDLNFKYIQASTAQDAFKLIPRLKPHLIVTDLYMPETDGIEVCRHIRQELRLRSEDVKLVVSSASISKDEKQQCLDLGVDALLDKPVSRQAIIRLFQKLYKTSPKITQHVKHQENTDKLDVLKLEIQENINQLEAQLASDDLDQTSATLHSLLNKLLYTDLDELTQHVRALDLDVKGGGKFTPQALNKIKRLWKKADQKAIGILLN